MVRTSVVFGALCLVQPVLAQPTAGPYTDARAIPETPAYQRALEIVDLINKGDSSAVEDYVGTSFDARMRASAPMAEHLGFFARVRQANGGLDVYAARSYDPPRPSNTAVLIVRGKSSENWRGISVEVENDPPHRITGMMVNPARPPSDLPTAERLTDAEIADQLGAYVDRLAAKDAFSGTVLLARDGEVLVTRAVGIANRDFNAPVTMDTKFNLGSMNKMMTGVACMQLVEAGKLSLEDSVSKYLSEDWLPKVDKDTVRVKHLLTHTSGLGSYFTDEWQRSSRALYRQVNDWQPIVRDETLAFEPGTQWQYSNTGMLIAGAIIEKSSGMSYYDYVASHVTGPAGMENSAFYETDRVNKNLAVGYEKEIGPDGKSFYRNNLYEHVVRGGPAGGGYSTVEDLLRFDRALRAGQLVKKESLEQLWRAYPDLHSDGYGLGFGIMAGPAGRVVGHTGGFPGISAAFHMYLDSGHTVIVLANAGNAAEVVDEKARELITQGL